LRQNLIDIDTGLASLPQAHDALQVTSLKAYLDDVPPEGRA
jgi:hypothetical protein